MNVTEEANGLAVDLSANLEASQFDITKHDGRLTIHNPETGAHRTFQIKTVRFGSLKGKRVVSLLIGPDTEDFGDWRGFGFADEFGVKVWHCFKGDGVRSEWQVFAGMLENPARWEARGARYLIEGRCQRCFRVLTVPSSLASGLGPECQKKGA